MQTSSIRWLEGFQPALQKLKQARIRFVIGGSYALRHHRQIRDLDIIIPPQDSGKLVRLGLGKLAGGSNWVYHINTPSGVIEIFRDSNIPGYEYDPMGEGYTADEWANKCWSLEHTLQWKTAFGRPKDKADIRLVVSAIGARMPLHHLCFGPIPR